VNILVTLSAASALTVTVPYALSGTAALVADYAIAPASPLSFQPNEVSKTVAVTLNNDIVVELNETVIITLGAPTNAVLGTQAIHTLTIQDNDVPTVQFAAVTSSARENAGTVNILVTLSAASPMTVTVPYATTGTATLGTDYTIAPASPLSFQPSELSKTVAVTISNDTLVEPNETVMVILGTPANGAVGAQFTCTLVIVDDDSPSAAAMHCARPYQIGGTASVTCRIIYQGTPSALCWQAAIPAGWSYASGTNEPAIKPAAGQAANLEWRWGAPPASPIEFTYTLNVPADQWGDKSIGGVAVVNVGAESQQVPAWPSPLVIAATDGLRADVNGDGCINVSDLLMVRNVMGQGSCR
jgi:hypothetical protein